MASGAQVSWLPAGSHLPKHSGRHMEGVRFAAVQLVSRVADSASGCTQYSAAGGGELMKEAGTGVWSTLR